MTTAEVADELGFCAGTVLALVKAKKLEGYRSGSRAPFRFTRESVMAFKGKESELRRPTATMQAMDKRLSDLEKLSIERDNRATERLKQLTRINEILERRVRVVENRTPFNAEVFAKAV